MGISNRMHFPIPLDYRKSSLANIAESHASIFDNLTLSTSLAVTYGSFRSVMLSKNFLSINQSFEKHPLVNQCHFSKCTLWHFIFFSSFTKGQSIYLHIFYDYVVLGQWLRQEEGNREGVCAGDKRVIIASHIRVSNIVNLSQPFGWRSTDISVNAGNCNAKWTTKRSP